MEVISGDFITPSSLKKDFKKLGVQSGMNMILHSSMKSLGGWVVGGAISVILALEEQLREEGTLVMPTHTPDLSDPSTWRNPPVRESWWEDIREQMPAFDHDFTPCWEMGIIPEVFRKQRGVIRSSHPQLSFAAWGANREYITANHSLAYGLGEQSPIARLYELDGWILLLGVGHGNNTCIHLAEYRADYERKKEMMAKAPVMQGNKKAWVAYKEVDLDSSDFDAIGADFARDTNHVRVGKVGNATALLLPVRDIVDYATIWMEKHRTLSAPIS